MLSKANKRGFFKSTHQNTLMNPFKIFFYSKYSYSILNFTSSTRKEIYVHSNELELNVGTAATWLELVGGINRKVSRIPPILPEWIYNGAIIAVQGGTQNVCNQNYLSVSFR